MIEFRKAIAPGSTPVEFRTLEDLIFNPDPKSASVFLNNNLKKRACNRWERLVLDTITCIAANDLEGYTTRLNQLMRLEDMV